MRDPKKRLGSVPPRSVIAAMKDKSQVVEKEADENGAKFVKQHEFFKVSVRTVAVDRNKSSQKTYMDCITIEDTCCCTEELRISRAQCIYSLLMKPLCVEMYLPQGVDWEHVLKKKLQPPIIPTTQFLKVGAEHFRILSIFHEYS